MYNLIDSTLTLQALALFFGAAVLHATFQLSAIVMTLMSGHALGRARSHGRLLHLCSAYVAGNALVIGLLIFTATYLVTALVPAGAFPWAAVSFIGTITGVGVLFFYNFNKGGRLWIPAAAANYLSERSKKTKNGVEACALGMTTALAELPFLAAPLLLASMVLRGQYDSIHAAVGLSYVLIASLPLVIILVLLGSGRKVSQLDRWRVAHRRFFQLISSAGLIALSLYAFTFFGLGSIEIGL